MHEGIWGKTFQSVCIYDLIRDVAVFARMEITAEKIGIILLDLP
jgi:hypothetical protein